MTTDVTARSDARFYQFTVENQVLDYVKSALRKSIASDEGRMGLERKVSTVKFVAESLVRHLRRLLELEDEAEEAEPLAEFKPHLADKVATLQMEHSQFRAILDELSEQIGRLSATDEAYFDAFCGDLLAFLDRLDRHEQAELEVLQVLHNSDEGGEG